MQVQGCRPRDNVGFVAESPGIGKEAHGCFWHGEWEIDRSAAVMGRVMAQTEKPRAIISSDTAWASMCVNLCTIVQPPKTSPKTSHWRETIS